MRRSEVTGRRPRLILLAAWTMMTAFAAAAPRAEAWWNGEWQYRMRIGFNTTPAGADIPENLVDFQVLVRLHSGNFNFANAKEDGSDLRFVSGDGATVLKHHIERFDPVDEIGLVWVKVPALSGNASQDFIWMYYGNPAATGGQDPAGTFDASQVLVYHLDEIEGAPKDRTVNANHASAFTGAQGIPSIIGNGVSLSGAEDRIVIPSSPTLSFAQGFTFSAWVRIAQPVQDGYLFCRQGENQESFVIGIDQTKAYCRMAQGEKNGLATEKNIDIPLNDWHHLTVTADAKRLTVYLNGIEMYWMDFAAKWSDLTGEIVVGAAPGGSHFFAGDLDELELSNVARSPAWVRAVHAVQGPDGGLLTFGEEELSGSEGGVPIQYIQTIVKNITLDGWAVIGLEGLMGLLSAVVFLNKAVFIRYAEKENTVFYAALTAVGSMTALPAEDENYPNSTLYRVYLAGLGNLKKAFGNPGPEHGSKRLSRKAIDALKADLERQFMEQVKKLNGWLVVLTIAITGAPFLGLLGTVWGVMNTFAAMAEAGEANIAAVAPGVASALACTIGGLLVALPALFAYNYLVSKIKNLTAEMSVFVDQFTLRIDVDHGVER